MAVARSISSFLPSGILVRPLGSRRVTAASIPSNGLTKKPNCAANQQFNVSYKHVDNVYEAYKLYLNDRWDTDKLTPVWE